MKTTILSSFVVGTAMAMLFACQGSSNNNGTNADSTGSINSAPDNTNAGTNSDSNAMGAQNNQSTQGATATQGTQGAASQSAGTLDERTRNFINEAAMGGMAEVELGKLAQDKAANPRVKNFGEMMVRDHSSANDDLKSIAQQKNAPIPADMGKHKSHYDELSKKQGADFDKAYMKMMVNDHNEDISAFEKASQNATDPQVKNFATQKLPILRKHLDSAKAIQKSLK
ncbi:MAG TPA: DUF4142 domain-containing protein [Niastella sp.]